MKYAKTENWGLFVNCPWKQKSPPAEIFTDLGAVYMTPGRLSRRSEFTLVPSHGSTFVYMIPPQNVMRARVTPVLVPGQEFH